MSSMNDVYEQMRHFSKELDHFHEVLQRSLKEMELRHGAADPLWKDSFRKQYDERWLPLQEKVQFYWKKTAPQYHRFLEEKLRSLERYLGVSR